MARFSLTEAAAHVPRIDEARLDATTDADIRAYQVADGMDPDAEIGSVTVVPGAREIRVRLAMTQKQFADALNIPVTTVRNWEQGRTVPDAPARSLLAVMARHPQAVLSTFQRDGRAEPPADRGSA